MMAATIVVIVPTIILTMILQKYIVQGMTAGAVKG
jgi:multiple sugar transport system permease protein